jgi:hypothetical protein
MCLLELHDYLKKLMLEKDLENSIVSEKKFFCTDFVCRENLVFVKNNFHIKSIL